MILVVAEPAGDTPERRVTNDTTHPSPATGEAGPDTHTTGAGMPQAHQLLLLL